MNISQEEWKSIHCVQRALCMNILENYNNVFSVENHCICDKYKKVLQPDTKYFIHYLENIQEDFYKYDELSIIIHESCQYTPYDTCDSSEINKK